MTRYVRFYALDSPSCDRHYTLIGNDGLSCRDPELRPSAAELLKHEWALPPFDVLPGTILSDTESMISDTASEFSAVSGILFSQTYVGVALYAHVVIG